MIEKRIQKVQSTFIPKDKNWDNTMNLFREGPFFISNRCEQLKSDIFQTRVMFQSVVCIRGQGPADFFHTAKHLSSQEKQAPFFVKNLIQNLQSFLMFEDSAAEVRHDLFASFITPRSLDFLAIYFTEVWHRRMKVWGKLHRINLFNEMNRILTITACQWLGIELSEEEIELRVEELSLLSHGYCDPNFNQWRLVRLRSRCNQWATKLIQSVRLGSQPFSEDYSPLHAIGDFKESHNNKLLPEPIAAAEVIHILMSIVSLSKHMVFAAHALDLHPEYRFRLNKDSELEDYIQEVQRFYSFFPFLGGKTSEPFKWREYSLKKNQWVLFDLYGANHHPDLWKEPNMFRPERFREESCSLYNLTPQGIYSLTKNSDSPNDAITLKVMKQFLQVWNSLDDRIHIPAQSLKFSKNGLPALSQTEFEIIFKYNNQSFIQTSYNL